MVTINNMFITGGQFIAAVIDGIFSPYKRNGWRYICTIIILLNYISRYIYMYVFKSVVQLPATLRKK